MTEAKKRGSKDAIMKSKELYKEFNFTAGILKGELAEGRKKKISGN